MMRSAFLVLPLALVLGAALLQSKIESSAVQGPPPSAQVGKASTIAEHLAKMPGLEELAPSQGNHNKATELRLLVLGGFPPSHRAAAPDVHADTLHELASLSGAAVLLLATGESGEMYFEAPPDWQPPSRNPDVVLAVAGARASLIMREGATAAPGHRGLEIAAAQCEDVAACSKLSPELASVDILLNQAMLRGATDFIQSSLALRDGRLLPVVELPRSGVYLLVLDLRLRPDGERRFLAARSVETLAATSGSLVQAARQAWFDAEANCSCLYYDRVFPLGQRPRAPAK